MKELENYNKSKEDLAKLFNLDDLWHNLVDCTDCKWYGDQREFSWIEPQDPESAYSCEVYGTSRWPSIDNEYTLYVGDNGSGDRDMYMFKNSNMITEDEMESIIWG